MKFPRLMVLGAVVAIGGYSAWHFTRPRETQVAAAPPVPVSAAVAKAADVPVYLHTIGNVRAINAVEIRPQVGGVLVDVAVKEGDEVKKNQLLAVIDPRPLKAALDKAQAQLTQDQAQLGNAEVDRQRYSALAVRDFASRQQLDTQASTVGRLNGVVAADRASIEEAQINLGYTVLKSPLDGRVGLRRVDPGNLIQANSTGPGILSVVQEQPISVIFSMPETDLPTVRAAMAKAALPALADLPDKSRALAIGTLATVDNTVDSSSGTIQLRADFPNTDRALTAGQFVNVRLQVDVAHGVTVPHVAVQHGQQGLFVFTIEADKSIRRQDVQVAYDDGEVAVLSSGLSSGATVVTAGQTRIGQGTKVAFKDDQPPPAGMAQ
ncbi:MAG: efflux RND transporter periplasmic adaptor subunit [Pseudomonadota bacterium]|nr:efflux RND transporter periplasmic adaptor subunit [Pseudomonadota bacterium]